MGSRKGEMSKAELNRLFPYQIAIPADQYSREHLTVLRFCRNRTVADRGHSVMLEDQGYVVRCFAEKGDALAFRLAFDGLWFNPEDRGKGTSWMHWRPAVRPLKPSEEQSTKRVEISQREFD